MAQISASWTTSSVAVFDRAREDSIFQNHPIDMATAFSKIAFLVILVIELTIGKDTPSPNTPIPKPKCDASIPVTIRYSSGSARVYVVSVDGRTRGGCVNLGQIWEHRGGKAPLYAVEPVSGNISDSATGTWLLTEELFVQDGITLQVRRHVVHWCGNICVCVPRRECVPPLLAF